MSEEEGIDIVQCYGLCKRFTCLIGAYFFEGHAYCEECRPDGAIKITKENLYRKAYGGNPETDDPVK